MRKGPDVYRGTHPALFVFSFFLSKGVEEKDHAEGGAEGKAEERLFAIQSFMASMG